MKLYISLHVKLINITTSICMDHNWWFTNFNVIPFCIMVLFLLSSRTNSSQNLIVKPSILSLLYIVTCETHQYCNSRFLGYRGLLNRVQSNLNITVNSMDFKITTINYEEFIPKKKTQNLLSIFFKTPRTQSINGWQIVYIYIYTHIQQQNLQSSLNLAIILSPSNISTLF